MATIYRKNGFIVRIWSNDHTPSHVHIEKGEGECVINLKGENDLPELREYYNMSKKDLSKALKIVFENQAQFIEKWNEIHGDK